MTQLVKKYFKLYSAPKILRGLLLKPSEIIKTENGLDPMYMRKTNGTQSYELLQLIFLY